jgi:hypothetical protein
MAFFLAGQQKAHPRLQFLAATIPIISRYSQF